MSVWEGDRLIYVGMLEKKEKCDNTQGYYPWAGNHGVKNGKPKSLLFASCERWSFIRFSTALTLNFGPDCIVVLPGPWFSHRCVMCGIQTHLLIASMLVLAHGHKWYPWKLLIWDERTKNDFCLWFTNKVSFASCSFILTFTMGL